MFLFKRTNKMIHTGNNGRGPGGPRLPSDGAVTPMTVGLLILPLDLTKTTCFKSAKIRSATVADGFVRLPPNGGDLGNVPRAG